MGFMQHVTDLVVWESRPSWQRALLVGGATIAVVGVSRCCYRHVGDYFRRKQLTEARELYRSQMKSKMEAFHEYLLANHMSPEDIQRITGMPASELLAQLRTKTLSPHEVLLAYQHKAFEVNQRLNCVTEFIIPDFSEIRLDGPLAGLPVSVKENFPLRDLVACAGCSELLCTPRPREDCAPIKVLKELGAVPFCRTNVPQTMMSFGSSNPVYGVTLHPDDPLRTPGGSSSGEGALVAAGGSPLGLGTDIGGSVRVPAAFCGVAGMKPTAGRFTKKNMISLSFQSIVPATWGLLAREVAVVDEVLRLFTECPLHRELDFQIPDLQWKSLEKRKFRIGYYTFDGFFHASPPLVNAVEEVKTALELAGHELVPFEIPGEPRERFLMYLRSIASDGGHSFRELLCHDAVDPILASSLLVANYSRFKHGVVSMLVQYVFGNEDAALYLSVCRGFPSVWRLWQHVREVELFKRRMEEAMMAKGVEALLCPSFGTVAPWAQNSGSFTGAALYTALFNLLNYPAGVVPVRRVETKDLEPFRNGEYPVHLGMWHKNVAKFHEGSEGLPVAVQVATPMWQDEKCLVIMKEIEEAVKRSYS